jgi:hypothetical protein
MAGFSPRHPSVSSDLNVYIGEEKSQPSESTDTTATAPKNLGMGDSGKMSKTLYVTCTVSQGLFDSEFYITVRDSSVYVDRVNVKVNQSPNNGDEVEGKVIAYLIEEKSDQALIELPGEPVFGSLRAWVPRADLAFA